MSQVILSKREEKHKQGHLFVTKISNTGQFSSAASWITTDQNLCSINSFNKYSVATFLESCEMYLLHG